MKIKITKRKGRIGRRNMKRTKQQGTHHADVVLNERTRLKMNEAKQNMSWAKNNLGGVLATCARSWWLRKLTYFFCVEWMFFYFILWVDC